MTAFIRTMSYSQLEKLRGALAKKTAKARKVVSLRDRFARIEAELEERHALEV